MKIFLDSAKLDEIKQAYSCGIVDGITTNPSLIKKAVDELKKKNKKVDMKSYIKQILNVAKGTPVSLEVTETTYEGMVKQGKGIYKMFNPTAKNVYIKIPVNPSFTKEPSIDGIKAIRTLSKQKIPVNCTLIFTPEQALMAAKAGAKFVSPFVGREDDLIRKLFKVPFKKTDYYPDEGVKRRGKQLHDAGIVSGIDLVSEIVDIFREHNIKCEVLAASIRNPQQFREAALVGADIATLPFNVIMLLLNHTKTREGMINFTKDVVPEYAKLIGE